jgi:hypothetical protein
MDRDYYIRQEQRGVSLTQLLKLVGSWKERLISHSVQTNAGVDVQWWGNWYRTERQVGNQ